LTWNYWFNDAVSTASDLVALQLLLEYWTTNFPGWALSLIFWVVLILANIITVRAYGEVEYWLSLLKIITIIVSLRNTSILEMKPLIWSRSLLSWGSLSTPVVTLLAITSAEKIGTFPVLLL
jgi:hypothetical protein